MLALLSRMGLAKQVTAHGMRATFKTWATEQTNFQREVVEFALGHTIKSEVEAAYQRGDLLEKRRRLMSEWSAFITGNPAVATAEPAQVLPIGGRRRRR
jgi:integrase